MQGQAKAVLTYNIFESAGNVVVQTSGSLNLTGVNPSTTFNDRCGSGYDGLILSASGVICTGPAPASGIPIYDISGPNNFNGTVAAFTASSVSGIFTNLAGSISSFVIDPAYVSNSTIVSSATFNGTDLATLGFTTTGLIGTWTINGTSESIQVILGAPAAAVPGPLPLFGAAAAFGWSRKLRRRIAAPLSTPPQA